MEIDKQLPYDDTDRNSILEYARRLVDKTLRDLIDVKNIATNKKGNKGEFGQELEKHYFGYEPNSNSEPDFPAANLELKTTALKILKTSKEFRAKERLSLNIINFIEIADEDFSNSSVLKKNASLLIIAYLYDPKVEIWDLLIKIVDIWDIPAEDLKIIEDDWNIILAKIRDGKAHELSEGDTQYLGAARKGSKGGNLREQPNTIVKAQQRGFSFKGKYINLIIRELLIRKSKRKTQKATSESIVKSVRDFDKYKTFDKIVQSKVQLFIGKNTEEIYSSLPKNLKKNLNKNAKNYVSRLSLAMLGSSKTKITEFEKGDVSIKTIRLKKNGLPKEDMSFPAFKYKELANETWEESTFRERLTKRFFLVFFQYNESKELVFRGAYFWTIPYKDLESEVNQVWHETVNRIINGRSDELPKKSENPVAHVRPHARNSQDTNETPDGQHLVKKSFWLNASYIKEQYEYLTKDRLHNI